MEPRSTKEKVVCQNSITYCTTLTTLTHQLLLGEPPFVIVSQSNINVHNSKTS